MDDVKGFEGISDESKYNFIKPVKEVILKEIKLKNNIERILKRTQQLFQNIFDEIYKRMDVLSNAIRTEYLNKVSEKLTNYLNEGIIPDITNYLKEKEVKIFMPQRVEYLVVRPKHIKIEMHLSKNSQQQLELTIEASESSINIVSSESVPVIGTLKSNILGEISKYPTLENIVLVGIVYKIVEGIHKKIDEILEISLNEVLSKYKEELEKKLQLIEVFFNNS